MKLIKYRVSKAEQLVLGFYLIIVLLACGIAAIKPKSNYIFEAIIGSIMIYMVFRYALIVLTRFFYELWSRSPIWPYRVKFVQTVINLCMYSSVFLVLVVTIKAGTALDAQSIIYACGFLGLLAGGLKSKELII